MSEEEDTLLSILFADVAGNARIHEKLGNEEALRAIDRCLKRIERAVKAFGGRTLKARGNELMAVFDSADAALQSAVEMQQRVADLPPVSGLKLEIRVGFVHGQATLNENDAAGEAVKLAAYLAGLARPGQVLTSMASITALSPALQAQTRETGTAPMKGKLPQTQLFEVFAPDTLPPVAPATEPRKSEASSGKKGSRLLLRYAGTVVTVDDHKPRLELGRDEDSDLVIKGRKVSRSHARIERRDDRFYIIDQSTNGTFLNLPGKPEMILHNQEYKLSGKGVIGFAASVKSSDTDCVEFEQL